VFSSGPSPDSNTTRASRQQEKEQLSGLNDRLASYIERVRNLEMENQSLHVKLHEVEEVDRHERSETVGRYEGRVEDLRGRLDALAKEKIK
jgi:regulator of replication initiation timing